MDSGFVPLTGEQLHGIRYCIAETIRWRVLGARPVPGWMRALDEHLKMSVGGRNTGVRQQESDQIDTDEAARILGCSTRHTRRIAADLDGVQISGRWIFHRRTVIEYVEARNR
ncbi:hypothetical protein MINS_03900 [Mycolicibacterium insubricum]|uniref:Uncharacterized protein n=1 Tax=Mycolicibacterium insubricum TaxID=444597 RepID=A0A1X0CYF1_9MYCO|nr:hypothetical protein BST26_19085 [Mycolicibacterium insubricum]BBZ64961.1 hypothetical protein MINS_03900 [Mycolicibacterium insubricum]